MKDITIHRYVSSYNAALQLIHLQLYGTPKDSQNVGNIKFTHPFNSLKIQIFKYSGHHNITHDHFERTLLIVGTHFSYVFYRIAVASLGLELEDLTPVVTAFS